MINRRIRIQRLAPQDRDLWQVLFYRHQQHSRRRRLLAVKALWDGQTLTEVCRTQHLQRKTLGRWVDAYLHGGFDALLAPQQRPRAQTLSPQRRKILRHILLHKTLAEYGLTTASWPASASRMSSPVRSRRSRTVNVSMADSEGKLCYLTIAQWPDVAREVARQTGISESLLNKGAL